MSIGVVSAGGGLGGGLSALASPKPLIVLIIFFSKRNQHTAWSRSTSILLKLHEDWHVGSRESH